MSKKIKRTRVDSLNIHAMKWKDKNWSLQDIQTKNQALLESGHLKWRDQFDQIMRWVQKYLWVALVVRFAMGCVDANSLKTDWHWFNSPCRWNKWSNFYGLCDVLLSKSFSSKLLQLSVLCATLILNHNKNNFIGKHHHSSKLTQYGSIDYQTTLPHIKKRFSFEVIKSPQPFLWYFLSKITCFMITAFHVIVWKFCLQWFAD